MTVQGVSIALSTEDVARSVKFYVEQLGFTCTLQLRGRRFRPASLLFANSMAFEFPAISNKVEVTEL